MLYEVITDADARAVDIGHRHIGVRQGSHAPVERLGEGAYDITLLPALSAWGFGPRGRVTERPTAEQLESLRGRIGMQHLRVAENGGAKELCKDADVSIRNNFV